MAFCELYWKSKVAIRLVIGDYKVQNFLKYAKDLKLLLYTFWLNPSENI